MAVEVEADGQVFRSGVPKPLSRCLWRRKAGEAVNQVAANVRTFLVNVPLESTLSAPITVVTNWTAGLKK